MTRSAQRWIVWLALAIALPAGARAQPAPEVRWSLRLSGELGLGTRDFDLPMDGVVNQTRTGAFPAAGLGFELDHAATDAVSLGLLVRYQSSVGLGIQEQHADGSQHPLDARSLRLELAFVPRFRLDASGDWVLSAAAGYALSDFRPEAHHLVTPAYHLAGPELRMELHLPPLFDAVRLRLGPELHLILDVGEDLIDRGMDSQGLGLGGEAGVEVLLGRPWRLHATYREVHTWLDSSQAQSFEDVTRFVTLGLSGKL